MPPASAKIIITGVRDIDRRLKSLTLRVQKKVVRKAMREGMKVVAAAARKEVPVDRGITKKAIKVRAVKSRKRDSIELEVRVAADDDTKRTSAKTGETVFYPAIVEYGDKHHAPNPFMRRAYLLAGEDARQKVLDALRRGVEKEISAKG